MIIRMVLLFVIFFYISVPVHAGALLDAVRSGNSEAVEDALAGGADVNERSGFLTPLIAAVRGENLDIVKRLLAAQADVNLAAGSGTPLSVACSFSRPEIVKLLLDAGADARLAKNALAPLHRAAENGCLECVKLLLSAGADNNALTSEGTPALHLAIVGKHTEVANLLRSAGYTPRRANLNKDKLATADANRGQVLFDQQCAGCHQTSGPERRSAGPPLYGVVGRAKASFQGWNYSEALRTAGGTWTYEDLNSFLSAPAAVYPGTAMSFGSFLDESARADIIAFLRSQHDSPPPLP